MAPRGWMPIGAAALAIAAGVTGCGSSDGPEGSAAEAAPASTSDDWLAAVCEPGTYFPAQTNSFMRSGTLYGTCNAVGHEQGMGSMIAYGSYNSKFLIENDASLFFKKYYATGVADSGDTIVFAQITDGDPSALSPLVKYGFMVNSVKNGR